MNKFWLAVWEFCEFYEINLGRLAPYVFGKMIGRKGKRVVCGEPSDDVTMITDINKEFDENISA